jgi:cytochrome c oxidase subunit II
MRHDTLRQFSSLFPIYIWLMVGVTAIVWGMIAFAVWRYRARPGRLPSTRTEAPRLEVAYAAGLAVIVCVLVTLTFLTEHDIDPATAHPGLRIDVTAAQWNWRFRYPDAGVTIDAPTGRYPTLVVPTDTTIEFRLRSVDVIHNFWIPALRFKRYAFPGTDHVNRFDLVFSKPGRMLGQCAQFCGWNHAGMRFAVRALPRAQFRAWLRRRAAA